MEHRVEVAETMRRARGLPRRASERLRPELSPLPLTAVGAAAWRLARLIPGHSRPSSRRSPRSSRWPAVGASVVAHAVASIAEHAVQSVRAREENERRLASERHRSRFGGDVLCGAHHFGPR